MQTLSLCFKYSIMFLPIFQYLFRRIPVPCAANRSYSSKKKSFCGMAESAFCVLHRQKMPEH